MRIYHSNAFKTLCRDKESRLPCFWRKSQSEATVSRVDSSVHEYVACCSWGAWIFIYEQFFIYSISLLCIWNPRTYLASDNHTVMVPVIKQPFIERDIYATKLGKNNAVCRQGEAENWFSPGHTSATKAPTCELSLKANFGMRRTRWRENLSVY